MATGKYLSSDQFIETLEKYRSGTFVQVIFLPVSPYRALVFFGRKYIK
jgi:hypothetical protein